MKVTTAKHGLRSIVTAFFLFGALLFCASSANAQTTSDVDLTLNWVDESNALTALNNTVLDLVADQANVPQGGSQWINDADHIGYYKWIMTYLNNGSSVAEAVNQALATISSPTSVAPMTLQTPLNQLKTDATTLLTQ